MLPFILLMSLLCQGHADDCGTEFITAFPENLAYYFPAPLKLYLKITTYLPNTQVKVSRNTTSILDQCISTVGVMNVGVSDAEINQFGVSGNTIRIISDKKICVVSYNRRGDSIQVNMVPPTKCLGKDYLVPSPNYTEFAVKMNTYNTSMFVGSTIEPIDFSMRLLIINAEAVSNIITVIQKTPTGDITDSIKLDPYALTLLPSNSFWYEVSSTAKVAVIITNPCMDTQNCRCNLVAHQLRPTDCLGTDFIFPPIDSSEKRLFITSSSSVDFTSGTTVSVAPASIGLLSFSPGQSTTSKPSSVRVILPGLIIDLIPNNMFSGCFLVQTNYPANAKALIIVQTAKKGDIQMNSAPLDLGGAQWTALNDYSWVVIQLSSCWSCVIWHPTSPIAVYVLETSGSQVTFGGPAISLNDEPDPDGCVVVPTQYTLSNVTTTWQEARSYCIQQGLVMASPNIEYAQQKMTAYMSLMGVAGDVWLGLRRDLVTSEWNWHKAVNFTYSYWDYNQPSSNLCASVNMAAGGNYTWSSVRCCSQMFPLCARDMTIVNSLTDPSLSI